MDLSWPYTPVVSINGYTPKHTYLGELKKKSFGHQTETLYNLYKKVGKVASSTAKMFPEPTNNCHLMHVTGHSWD